MKTDPENWNKLFNDFSLMLKAEEAPVGAERYYRHMIDSVSAEVTSCFCQRYYRILDKDTWWNNKLNILYVPSYRRTDRYHTHKTCSLPDNWILHKYWKSAIRRSRLLINNIMTIFHWLNTVWWTGAVTSTVRSHEQAVITELYRNVLLKFEMCFHSKMEAKQYL